MQEPGSDPEPEPELNYKGLASTSETVDKSAIVVPFPDTHEKCYFQVTADKERESFNKKYNKSFRLCLSCPSIFESVIVNTKLIRTQKKKPCYIPASLPEGYSCNRDDAPMPYHKLFPKQFTDELPEMPKKYI